MIGNEEINRIPSFGKDFNFHCSWDASLKRIRASPASNFDGMF